MIEDVGHEITAGGQHGDDVVDCREPEIIDICRERFEAHPGAGPVGDSGNAKLGVLSDRKL